MKFHVGDKVVIDNLDDNVHLHPGIAVKMRELFDEGIIFTVSRIHDNWVWFEEDEDTFIWHEDWLRLAGIKKKVQKKKENKITKRALSSEFTEIRKEMRKKARSTSCCSYAVIVNNNGAVKTQYNINDICHARLIPYGQRKRKILGVLDWIGSPKERFTAEQYKMYKQYADYIINRSYVKDAFIPTSFTSYVRYGVKLNVEASSTQAMTGLIALRIGSEKKNILPVFCLIKEAGFSEEIAMLMAFSFQKKIKGDLYQFCVSGNHHPIEPGSSPKKMLDIVRKEFEFPKEVSLYEATKRWEVFNATYSKNQKGSWTDFLASFLSPLVGTYEQWGMEYPNDPNKEQLILLAQHIQDEAFKEKK